METQNKKLSDYYKYYFDKKENLYYIFHQDDFNEEIKEFIKDLKELDREEFFNIPIIRELIYFT